MCVCMYVCIYLYICMYVCVCICVYTCACMGVYRGVATRMPVRPGVHIILRK